MNPLTIEREPEAPVPAPTATTAEERAIATLVDHPGFLALKKQYDAHEEAWLLRIASQVKSSPKIIDQRKVDFARGYFAGAANLIGRVTAAVEATRPKEDA